MITNDSQITVKLPKHIRAWLDRETQRTGAAGAATLVRMWVIEKHNDAYGIKPGAPTNDQTDQQ